VGHVTNFEILGPSYNVRTNRAIRFQFGTVMEDGPLQCTEYKASVNWAWPGSRDPISIFWDP